MSTAGEGIKLQPTETIEFLIAAIIISMIFRSLKQF